MHHWISCNSSDTGEEMVKSNELPEHLMHSPGIEQSLWVQNHCVLNLLPTDLNLLVTSIISTGFDDPNQGVLWLIRHSYSL